MLQGLQDAGVDRVLSWDEFLQVGADNPREAVPPKAEDISTVMYTSGTTGMAHARFSQSAGDEEGVIHLHPDEKVGARGVPTATCGCSHDWRLVTLQPNQ